LKKNWTTQKSNPAFPKIIERRQWLSKGKNWKISNARVLVERFLTHPI